MVTYTYCFLRNKLVILFSRSGSRHALGSRATAGAAGAGEVRHDGGRR